MTVFQIEEIGSLLNQMLKGTMFDHFLLQEASVSQAFRTDIDGTLRTQFYSEEEMRQRGLSGLRFLPFSHVRPFCLDLIRGNRKPESFRFVFLLSPQNQAGTIAHAGSSFHTEDVTGMFLNLSYKKEILTCSTGISYRIFSPDKSLEKEWDRLAMLFFRQHGIAVKEL
ncbi:MAG: DUF5721 family protein [Clostridiales bacterium]|nr:DUF5721 family protein [Clostridiales bacterium]